MEHIPFLRFWTTLSGGKKSMTYQSMPRTLHGSLEAQQPRTDELLKWYPFKNELTVDGKIKPTFTDILHTYYWPKTLTDAERIAYVSEKSGKSEEELSMELYRMRRLKMGVAQSIRMKLRGRGFRQPESPDGGMWYGKERAYMMASGGAASSFGMSFYNNPTYEPFIVYSPMFQFGGCVDMVLNKPLRTSLQYCLVEVCLHNSIPKARLPGVVGQPKYPIHMLEPCEWEEIRLRLSVMAILLKKETYVVDHVIDGGHKYIGAIVHLYDTHDEDGAINWDIQALDLDLDLAEQWLLHYKETILGPAN